MGEDAYPIYREDAAENLACIRHMAVEHAKGGNITQSRHQTASRK